MSYRYLRNPAAYTIRKEYHTKLEKDYYLVVPTERLGDEFGDFRASARAAGGWYNRKYRRVPGGFAFNTRQEAADWAAEAFDDDDGDADDEGYVYGSLLRPVGPNTMPPGYIAQSAHPDFPHGTVTYPTKLTPDRARDASLILFITDEEAVAQIAAEFQDNIGNHLAGYEEDRAQGKMLPFLRDYWRDLNSHLESGSSLADINDKVVAALYAKVGGSSAPDDDDGAPLTTSGNRPLYGHTTEATAYKQTVGGKTRAYWLEYKPKKGYRIASRTVAPRMTEPVRSTYTMVGALFLNENGEVGRWVPRDHQPDSYMEFLALFPDLDKRTLARAHDWAMYSQRPGVGVAEKREAWKEVQAKAKSMWENASAAAEPEKKPEKATDTAKMTAEEYTAAISKAIKQGKKKLGVKSVSQGYKGTGSRAAERGIVFVRLDGAYAQLRLSGGGWGFSNIYDPDLSNVSQRSGTFTRDLKTDANQIRKALAQWTGVLPPDAPEAPTPTPVVGFKWPTKGGNAEIVRVADDGTGRIIVRYPHTSGPGGEIIQASKLSERIAWDAKLAGSAKRQEEKAKRQEEKAVSDQEVVQVAETKLRDYLSNFENPKRGRIAYALRKKASVQGELAPRYQHMERLVSEGYTKVGTVGGKPTLENVNGSGFFFFSDLTKTGVDYAQWLASAGGPDLLRAGPGAAEDVKAPVVPSPTPAPPADTTRTTQVVLGVEVRKTLPHFEVYATLTPTTTGESSGIKMARFSYTDKADADAMEAAAERYAKDLENRQMIALLGGAPAQLEGWISTFCQCWQQDPRRPQQGERPGVL